MSTNPLKNCIAFDLDRKFIRLLSSITNDPSHEFHEQLVRNQPVDPSGGQWGSSGITPTTLAGNEPITPLTPNSLIMAVQFNERILPGKVRDEHLAEKIADIREREGRYPGRKEYAQLREQVEFDLLPKAFIRRSWVYVTFVAEHNLMLVHTSSAKRSDDAVATLNRLFTGFPVDFKPTLLRPKHPNETLSRLARGDFHESLGRTYETTDSATLIGGGKQVVRIKDLEIESSDEVDTLLDQDYRVTELGLKVTDDDIEETIRFSLNDKFVFKRIDVTGVKLLGNPDPEAAILEFQSYALTQVTYMSAAVIDLLEAMGGHVDLTGGESKDQAPALTDEDDKL